MKKRKLVVEKKENVPRKKVFVEPYLRNNFSVLFCHKCKKWCTIHCINSLCKKRINENVLLTIDCLHDKHIHSGFDKRRFECSDSCPSSHLKRKSNLKVNLRGKMVDVCPRISDIRKKESFIHINDIIFIERKDKLAIILIFMKLNLISIELLFMIIKCLQL